MDGRQGRKGEARDNKRRVRLDRPEYEGVRRRILEAIRDLGTTQKAVSNKLGLGPIFVNHIVVGRRTIDITELVDIAAALNISPIELLQAGLDYRPDPDDRSKDDSEPVEKSAQGAESARP